MEDKDLRNDEDITMQSENISENEKNEEGAELSPDQALEKEKEEFTINIDPDIRKEESDEEEEPIDKPDYAPEIAAIIRSNASPKSIRDALYDYHDNDIESALEILTPAERKKAYRILDEETISSVLEYADEDEAKDYLDEMDIKKAVAVLSHMEADTAVAVLRAMDKVKRSIMFDLFDEEFRKDIALLASFDEDDIGSKMTTNYIVIHDNLSIKEAMHELVAQASKNDNISTIFVLDSDDYFCGAIDLKDLIIARQGTPLSELIMTSYPYVYGNETIDDCIERLKEYSEDLIPVLDNQNYLLGVITSQNIIEVVDDELSEDYARLAGLTAEEEMEEPLKESMKKRLPWLIILMFLGLIISSVVGVFENVIRQLTVIMLFQSLILDMSGNSGTQSLAVTIRVLMDENLTAKQKRHFAFKELRVGFTNGLLIALCAVVFVGGYVIIFKHKPIGMGLAVSACVGISLLASMTISSGVGTLIPMFFKKINVDPAAASGPLITTMNDLTAIITYYSLAYILLIRLLGYTG